MMRFISPVSEIFITFCDGGMFFFSVTNVAWVFHKMQKCESVLCVTLCATAPSHKAIGCSGVALSNWM